MGALTQMTVIGQDHRLTERVPFTPTRFVSDKVVADSFYFAWDMSFGAKGEHRPHRSGGTAQRSHGEVFASAFQGKLAEFAASAELSRVGIEATPDLAVAGLGVWDASDLRVGKRDLAVKSTKSYGNLVLLEVADWSSDGQYRHHAQGEGADALCLVRIKPSPEDLLRKALLLRRTTVKQVALKWAVAPLSRFRYQVVGAVSRDTVRAAIRARMLIPRGATLNGRTRMDADNYYIQACDLLPLEAVVRSWRLDMGSQS